MPMYRDEELLGKEVIDASGEFLGEVLEITIVDDAPCMLVGERKFLASKERIINTTAVKVPYYEIASADDVIILKKSREELRLL
ncbi:PRC-barrel domain-containing protein [Candidatus Pyrohabitans sp.]